MKWTKACVCLVINVPTESASTNNIFVLDSYCVTTIMLRMSFIDFTTDPVKYRYCSYHYYLTRNHRLKKVTYLHSHSRVAETKPRPH